MKLLLQTYLARASQIISTKRCKEDEALLNAYVLPGKKAFIVDIRTYSSGRPTRGKPISAIYSVGHLCFIRIYLNTSFFQTCKCTVFYLPLN